MKTPCKQCLVSPCCNRRCDDKIGYDEEIAAKSKKRSDFCSDSLAFAVIFGTFLSPIWLRIVAAFFE